MPSLERELHGIMCLGMHTDSNSTVYELVWSVAQGPQYKQRGYGGVLAAGYWGPLWRHDPVTSYQDW